MPLPYHLQVHFRVYAFPARLLVVISVYFFTTTEKLVELRRFNLIGERKLAQQKPDLRRIGKRRALVVRDNNGGTTH